jgi:AcrR family transcriptional regulator
MEVTWLTAFVQFRCKVFIMSRLIKVHIEFTVKYYRKDTVIFILLIDISVNNAYNNFIRVKGVVKMAPRSYEANEQIKDERRNQILQSALKIFTRKGLAAAKISDISTDIGISYGLVYHYFKSKEDIYFELVDYAINSIEHVIEEVKREVDEPIEQIQQIAARVLSSIENKDTSGFYYVLIMNAITCEAAPIPASKIIEECMNRLALLADIISNGQKRGQIREGDPMELAVTCFSALIGLASLKVSGTIKTLPDSDVLMRLF